MTVHEHQWVFAGEVVIPKKQDQLRGQEDLNRLEYCVVCGAFRIRFGSTWRFWYSEASKNFLNQFEGESHNVVKIPPPEFRLDPPVRGSSRLGRGLSDLMQQVQSRGTNMESLLKGAKNETKGRT